MNTLGKSLLALALVALTASPALAQRGGGGGFGGGMMGGGAMLLSNAGVQDELKLTDDQKSKVNDLAEKAREKARDAFQGLEGQERMAKVRELNADTMKSAAEILKPEQVARLKGIQYQAQGVGAFQDEELQKALKLTDDQKSEMASIARESMEKARDARESAGDDREAAMAKMREIRKDALAKAESKLNAEQKAEFAKLLGAPYEVRFEGRGPGGGRRNNN